MSAMSSYVESKCKQHPSEEFRFYCEDCEILICDDCITGAHKNHKNIKIKEFGAKIREELQKMPTKAETTRLPEIQDSVEKAVNGKDAFCKSVQEGIDKIRIQKEKINSIFDKLEKELVDSFKQSEIDATQIFDLFIERQEEKANKIKKMIEELKSKETNITNDEAAKYQITFEKLLKKDPFKDFIPTPPKLKYIFNAEFSKEEKLQQIIGILESDDYSTLEELTSELPPVVPRRLYSHLYPNTDTPEIPCGPKTEIAPPNDKYDYLTPEKSAESYEDLDAAFTTITKFQTESALSFIVPKATVRQGWVLGSHITDVDCSKTESVQKQIQPLTTAVVTACLAKNDKLLIGLQNVQHLWKLDVGLGSSKLVRGFKVCSGKEKIACICRSTVNTTDHIACIETKTQFVLRRYSNGKALNKDLGLTEIDNPVQIAENSFKSVCILCQPREKSSWVVVLDKDGKKILRFPPEEQGEGIIQTYVGAGFKKDGSLLLVDQKNPSIKQINFDGNCVVEYPLESKPLCSNIDKLYNTWVAFEHNEVKLFKCNTENVYEVLNDDTNL